MRRKTNLDLSDQYRYRDARRERPGHLRGPAAVSKAAFIVLIALVVGALPITFGLSALRVAKHRDPSLAWLGPATRGAEIGLIVLGLGSVAAMIGAKAVTHRRLAAVRRLRFLACPGCGRARDGREGFGCPDCATAGDNAEVRRVWRVAFVNDASRRPSD